MYDIVIRGGKVIDGAGNPWYKADIGVKNGVISKIGKLVKENSETIIDASGHIVSPGFIDAHSHADGYSLVCPEMENLVHQGITTVVAGQCGSSPAPVSDLVRDHIQSRLDKSLPEGVSLQLSWSTFDEYLKEEEKLKLGANVAHLVGHGAIRSSGMGLEARAPTADELVVMRELTAEAMEAGAYGLSTGLIYPPGIYAETEEIIELAKVAANFGGIYDSS